MNLSFTVFCHFITDGTEINFPQPLKYIDRYINSHIKLNRINFVIQSKE